MHGSLVELGWHCEWGDEMETDFKRTLHAILGGTLMQLTNPRLPANVAPCLRGWCKVLQRYIKHYPLSN